MSPSEDTLAAIGATYKGRPIEQVAQPFIDEVNAQGGINGRKVVPAYTRFNPASADDMVAACINQSQDKKVFASLALLGFYGEGEVCMANHQTPTLTPSNSSAYTLYQREKGWVRQTSMDKDRTLAELDRLDRRVAARPPRPPGSGLVYTDVPEDRQIVQDVVLPYLKAKGLNVKDVAVFTLSSIDAMVGEAQRATFKFKADGIELVLPVTNFLQFFLFVQQADLTGYVPRYTVTDFGGMATRHRLLPGHPVDRRHRHHVHAERPAPQGRGARHPGRPGLPAGVQRRRAALQRGPRPPDAARRGGGGRHAGHLRARRPCSPTPPVGPA